MDKDVGGHKEVVQGLECHLPPVGKVYDYLRGELIDSHIMSRSPKKAEQYW